MILVETWKLVVLQRYAKFSGRAGRSEFWWFVLANALVYVALAVLIGLGAAIAEGLGVLFVAVGAVYLLGTFVPNLAVSARRLHDTNKSGKLLLLYIPNIIPIIGIIWGFVVGIVFLIFYATEGNPGPNQYGDGPDSDASSAAGAPKVNGRSQGSGTESQWAPDPFGRHDHRYFNGRSWTDKVADAGAQGTDDPGYPVPSQDDGWAEDPFGRFPQRYFKAGQWTAHVAQDGTTLSDPATYPAPAAAAVPPPLPQ